MKVKRQTSPEQVVFRTVGVNPPHDHVQKEAPGLFVLSETRW